MDPRNGLMYICRELNFTCVSTCFPSYLFEMLSLYDLLEILNNDDKRKKWTEKYNLSTTVDECPSCVVIWRRICTVESPQ